MNEAVLNEWVATRASEGETLEFKSALTGTSDGGKNEFLKDVSAMANGAGGTIVFGIKEEDGQASELVGITTETADYAIRRLEQSMQSSIEPRLTGVRFTDVPLTAGGYALVITIPRSFNGPHRVTLNQKNAFYFRANRHISEFSYSQLRDAFTMRGRAEELAETWQTQRIGKIKSGVMPKKIYGGPKYVLHLLPLAAFSGVSSVDVMKLRTLPAALMFGQFSSCADATNLEGLISTSPFKDGSHLKYVQLFRHGCIEVAGFAGRLIDEKPFIPTINLVYEIRAAIKQLLPHLITLGVTGPAMVSLSLISVGKHHFAFGTMDAQAPDRDDIHIPAVWVEAIESAVSDPSFIGKEIFDLLWQAFGRDSCPYYEASGAEKAITG